MEQQHNICLNDDLIAQAQLKLNTISDYLEKIVKEYYIPEDQPTSHKKLTMADLWGLCEGKLWTSDDFDEPLDDLKE